MSVVTMLPTKKTALAKAVVVQMRVLADLAHRWFEENNEDGGGGRAAAWSRHRTLVIVASGSHADRIVGELQRAHLIDPQLDKPEHLDPRPTA